MSIELTPQARLNLGLTEEYLQPIRLQSYQRTITVPAVVAAKPGRSQIIVSSPLNGVVTHVHAVTGEAVMPGELLFEVRLTYEDLVETQTQYLKTISELEVEAREIERLEKVTQSGAISGKVLLDRRYAKEKLEALLRSQREALRLHGLSDRQVDAIGNDGRLLRT
ncbi:MAG: efflux RND transporter periplasmic adaptor subunit [Pirellulaceae bacterium]